METVKANIFHRFYWIFFMLGLLLSVYVPIKYWDESYTNSFLIIGATRLLITTNISWLVNSALLVWGLKKGDKLISIFHTFSLLYKLFFEMPKSHDTVLVDEDRIRCKYYLMKIWRLKNYFTVNSKNIANKNETTCFFFIKCLIF